MKKYLIIASLLIMAIVGGFIVYDALVFRVTSSDPSQNGSANYTQSISISFNRELDAKTLKDAAISPYTAGKFTITGKKVVFTPASSLRIGEDYSLTLPHPTSTNGDSISTFKLKFKVKYQTYNSLSDNDKQKATQQTDSLEKRQPIVQYLPHEETHFKIDFTVNPDSSLNLNVTTYGIQNRPEQQSVYAQQTLQYRNEAQRFITDHGFKLSNYKIEYYPRLPTDPPTGGEPKSNSE